MADPAGEEVALVLLRALPPELADRVIGELGGEAAERLRARLRSAPPTPPTGPELDAALTEFFDLQRIAGRVAAAGEYRPVAPPRFVNPSK